MDREVYIPSPADSTPRPVAVTLDRAPDSSSSFSAVEAPSRQVRKSRGLIARLLVPAVVAGSILVGPEAARHVEEQKRQEVRAAIAEVAAKPGPQVLNRAQYNALMEFFPGEDGKKYDYEKAREIMDDAVTRTVSRDWQLPVGNFVSREQAPISEDGKTVELGGQHYSFAQYREEDGNLYILVARPLEEDNFVGNDRVHMVSPMLVGGQKAAEGMTPEEQAEAAYSNARDYLTEGFENSKKDRIILSQK